jgi:Geminivirus Rep catalytic domain
MNAKSFFLTYPQSDINPNDFLVFAQSKGNLTEFVIGRELHADGRPHLHAALKYSTAIRGTMALFDFEGRHPNVQSPRKFEACKQYCRKEGNFIENPREEQEIQPQEHLGELCKTYETEVDWFSYCAQNKIGFQYAKYFWESIHMDIITIRQDDDIPGTVVRPLGEFRWNCDQFPTLAVIGPAGCGKTTWAKISAPKPALFVSHIDQLKLFKVNFHKVTSLFKWLYIVYYF